MSDLPKSEQSKGIAGALTRAFIASPLTPLMLFAAVILGLVALITLPREEEPQISVPMVDIHVSANGLRAVIAALTGKAIPAFAAGGAYQGGLALVGEKGPELINFNGGGQVYTAQQTRGMFAGGGNAEVVAELRALRQDNANMRAELRAIAGSSAKTARHLDRMDADGLLVRTDADTPLATVAA